MNYIIILYYLGLYLEAGAIPAMLIQISQAFNMSPGLQGVLGGIAYLSLGFGSPFAGFLMKHYNHKTVLGYAIGVNSLLTLFWALTPVGYWFSSTLFIFIRFLMGLMQCVVCVFLPLWTNEFAPSSERTKWMGALQVLLMLLSIIILGKCAIWCHGRLHYRCNHDRPRYWHNNLLWSLLLEMAPTC